jgi:hypothetical protein
VSLPADAALTAEADAFAEAVGRLTRLNGYAARPG